MKKIFFTLYSQKNKVLTGGQAGSEKNYSFFKQYFSNNPVERLSIRDYPAGIISKICRLLFLRYFEPNRIAKEEFINIMENGVDVIFWDYFGGARFLKTVKKKYPMTKIIKFYHDIEFCRIKTLRSDKSVNVLRRIGHKIKNKMQYLETKKGDKVFVKYSDLIGCLNKRDGNILEEHFGRNYDFLLPVSQDLNIAIGKADADLFQTNSLLFVGVLTYWPNIEGLRKIINVIDKIDCNLYVIGSASNEIKEELSRSNVHFLGRVDSLDKYYQAADAVIAPIYSGGGMKVKICEALSYGKYIFGTKEAFEGYELDFGKVGGIFESPEDFKKQIDRFFGNQHLKQNEYSIKLFKENYANDVVYDRFKIEMDRLLR